MHGGQYVKGAYNATINETISTYHPVDTDFWYPIVWDNAHAFNIVFKRLRENKETSVFFSRLTNRLSLINEKMGIGKTFTMALETANEHNIPIRTTSCLSKTHFFSSNYKEIEKMIISLPAYIEALGRTKYK